MQGRLGPLVPSLCHWWVPQDCKLDAVLVLRIQNGNDIFLSVTGSYAPSFFGISLPSLASLPR